jgi:Pvc16 N-terminal domain
MKDKDILIFEVLDYLKSEINVSEKGVGEGEFANLGNISKLENNSSPSSAMAQDKIIVTVVNIEEEKTLKNNPHYVRKGDGIEKRNPTLFLNLYVLFCAPSETYENALTYISRIVGFFQKKTLFNSENASEELSKSFPSKVEKLVVEIVSLNFEQLNHLWGILGGKYMPSILYKIRMVPIQESESGPVELIEEIETKSNLAN